MGKKVTDQASYTDEITVPQASVLRASKMQFYYSNLGFFAHIFSFVKSTFNQFLHDTYLQF